MNIKIASLLIIILLFTIFVSQNTEPVSIQIFFWSLFLPKIVMIIIAGLLGVIAGILIVKISAKEESKINSHNSAEDNNQD